MWRAFEAANRPWPSLSDDDVVDYCIMEAVAVKISEEDKKRVADKKKSEWKKDTSALRKVAG